MIGKTLAHYEITAELGKGGMGEVWRARDTKLGREVAIKTLPEAFARDEQRLARFEREAKLLASLNHPHIASIYGLEEAEGTRFLVLELVEGETLADRLERGPIPFAESLRLALQIAEALEAAHEKGVIHRDLKPANIKITPDGKVKVLDFGLAKALAGDEVETSPNLSSSPTLSRQATIEGVILGTAAYMSPEQAKGLPVDRRSDVFSFGSVLFEMLTGRRAFRGELAAEILAAVINQDPDASLLPSKMHPQLKGLLRRCFEKDPKNRWQAVGDIRLELAQIGAEPEAADVRVRRGGTARTLRLVLPWAAASAVAAWLLKPTPPREPRVVSRFSYELPEGQRLTNFGFSVVTVSPDGRRIVYVANGRLFLRPLGELDSSPIPGTDEEAFLPVFSPDGEWVAYFSGQTQQLKKIPVSGGASVTLCDASIPVSGMSWDFEDTIVYGQSTGIYRVPSAGGDPSLLVPAEAGEEIYGPRLLPGREAVLFTSAQLTGLHRWDGAKIVVQSLDSGERKVLWSGGSDVRYVPTGHLVYARENVLFALPFDLGRLEVTGGPVPLVEGLRRAAPQPLSGGGANYDLSSSGSLVYATGSAEEGQRVLALVDRAGKVRRLDVPPAPYVSPRVSPDGSAVVVQTDGNEGSVIWLYDLSGKTAIRRLTFEGNNTSPIWTPDGKRITFASDRDGTTSLYWKQADGKGRAERLTTAEKGRTHIPWSWSPDGRILAFSSWSTKDQRQGELWTLSVEEGAKPKLFGGGPRWNGGATFSPDGKWLAYASDQDTPQNNQIFIEPFPTTGEKQRITRESAAFPVWSDDGRELFFRPSGEIGSVEAVDITTDPELRFSKVRLLPVKGFRETAGYRSFDPTPDGKGFVAVYPATDAASNLGARPSIRIVLNWVEELKARVPVRR